MKIVLTLSFLFLFVKIVKSQNFDTATNINYTHFTINPGAQLSSFKTDDPNNINVFHQSFVGLLSDIKSFYVDANYNLQSNNVIGFKVFTTQKTREITRPKFHLFYASKVIIKDNLNWSTGIQLGFANAYIGPTRSTAGGSDWAFDGSISTNLTLNSFSLGAGIHQFSSSTLRPVDFIFSLDRYYEIILLKQTNLNDTWELKSGLKSLLITNSITYAVDNQLIYNNQLSLLFAFAGFTKQNISIGGAFKFNIEEKHYLNTSLSYQINNRSTQSNAGMFMINVAYTTK